MDVMDNWSPRTSRQRPRLKYKTRSTDRFLPPIGRGDYDPAGTPFSLSSDSNDESTAHGRSLAVYEPETRRDKRSVTSGDARVEIGLINSMYGTGMPLVEIPQAIVDDFRRLIRVPAKISISTMTHFGIVGLQSRDGLVFPRYLSNQGEGNRQRPTGIKVYRVTSDAQNIAEDTIPRSRFGGLFGYHLIDPEQKEAVLTANEVDAMTVYQETKKAALAVQRMTTEQFSEMIPLLDQFEKLLIWFPPERRQIERARRLAHRLGQARCYFVDSFTAAPSTFMTTGKDIGVVLEEVEPLLHRSVETFENLRASVREAVGQRAQHVGIKWSRFPRFNQVLKGFRLSELTIFSGPTGSGKTTLLSEYSLDLAEKGVNTLWGSFELPNVRLAELMLQQMSRVEPERMSENQYEHWADKFQKLPIYFMRFYGAATTSTVIEEGSTLYRDHHQKDTIRTTIHAQEIHHVVIDNVQFLIGSHYIDSVDRLAQQDRIVEQFRQLSHECSTHVTLVLHPRRENPYEELTINSIFGSMRSNQAADNIIVIQQIAVNNPPYRRKYLQIIKNRFDGELLLGDRSHLEFDKRALSYSFVTRSKALNGKAMFEEK